MLMYRVNVTARQEGALLQHRSIPDVVAHVIHIDQPAVLVSHNRNIFDRF